MSAWPEIADLTDDQLDTKLADARSSLLAEHHAGIADRGRITRLQGYIAAVRAEQVRRSPAPEGYQGIVDDSLAVWAMDHIATATAERDRIRRNAQAYIDQIQADALADEKPLASRIGWFEGELRRYYEGLPDPPATYKLPNGQIARRKGRASTVVADADVFVAWAVEHLPDAVKRTPLVGPLKDFARSDDGQIVTSDGEVVPGVEVVVSEPTVSIKPAGRPT